MWCPLSTLSFLKNEPSVWLCCLDIKIFYQRLNFFNISKVLNVYNFTNSFCVDLRQAMMMFSYDS
jgi:hypothetical protein